MNGTIAGFAGRPYAEVAVEVIRPFVGDSIAEADLARMAREAYGTFRHPATAPLVQLGDSLFVLELFHGPTLAFKDLAMQLVARLMDHVLLKRSERTTIVVATSGDTGGAAVEAFRGRAQVDVVVLFPHGRISEVQRRMMTTAPDSNVHALAIEGTFDDCQALVKAMFNHHAFRDRVRLSGVNSINWARIVAQVVYYFTAAVALGAPHRKVAFTVPTGNFGDVYAGYVASRMGLPDRPAGGGDQRQRHPGAHASRPAPTKSATSSRPRRRRWTSRSRPISSGCCSRPAAATPSRSRLMGSLAQSRRFTVPAAALKEMRAMFTADRASEQESAATIRAWMREAGYCADPHTAVGLAVAEKETRDPSVPMVVLSTAHPAKFPDAVKAACGMTPALPDWLADLPKRQERVTVLPADQAAVEKFVLSASRAAREGAAA